MKNAVKSIKRGEIYYADLRPVVGSEQGGIRPVLIVQNNVGNKHSPTTIVISMTSQVNKKVFLPTHVILHKEDTQGLPKDSVILCEQLKTIDKSRIKDKIGCINDDIIDSVMNEVKKALDVSFGF